MTGEKLLWDDQNFSKQSNSFDAFTAVFAKQMLYQTDILNTPADVKLNVLDNACGNGIVTYEIQQLLKDRPLQITCGDLADAMLEAATERMQTEKWTNTTVVKLDAQDTKLPDAEFTHIFTNFGVMLVPKPDDMLNECHRMLKPEGVCAFTTWSKIGWFEDFKAAMASIPGVPEVLTSADELVKGFGTGDWDDAEYIKDTMTRHNFSHVEVQSLSNTTVIVTKEDIRRVVRILVSILTKKYWSEEEQSKHDNADLLEQVVKWLEQKYEDQPIRWHWEALVTSGRKG